MWVRRALVTDLVEIEEARGGDPFLAEGLESIAAVVGEEPACAEGDGLWRCGNLARGVLFQCSVQLGGRDEVGGEGAC